MNGMTRRLISLGVLVLVLAGALAFSAATLRAQGGPANNNPGQPFAAILAKLDQLIAAVPIDVSAKLDQMLGLLNFFNGGNTVGAWNRAYPAATRYVVLSEFNNEAFMDRETGLVWDRHGTFNHDGSFPVGSWFGSVPICYAKTIGHRQGWRPSTVEELSSLIGDLPDFPAGLLTGPVTSFTWTQSTFPGDTSKAWAIHPDGLRFVAAPFPKTDCCGSGVWCVRGGHGHDGQ